METIRIQSNRSETVYFVLLDNSGNRMTGLTGAQLNMLSLMRKSDGRYWDGDSWEPGKTDLTVIEQDAINSPGLHYYTTPALAEDEYVVTVDTPVANNVPQMGIIKAGEYVDDVDVPISSRSSHDNPDPGGYIDAAISSRSSHSANDVWNVASRTLTSFGSLVSDIWSHATRELTGFGTLIADIWNHATRTLTGFGTIVSDIWSYATRGLTESIDINSNADLIAIKAKTDNLPADPASESNVDANESKIDSLQADATAIKAKTDNLPVNTEEILNRILGLNHENIYQHSMDYTGGKLISAKLDVYDDKTNAQAHDGVTGIVAKYTQTFTWNSNELQSFEMVRDS